MVSDSRQLPCSTRRGIVLAKRKAKRPANSSLPGNFPGEPADPACKTERASSSIMVLLRSLHLRTICRTHLFQASPQQDTASRCRHAVGRSVVCLSVVTAAGEKDGGGGEMRGKVRCGEEATRRILDSCKGARACECNLRPGR